MADKSDTPETSDLAKHERSLTYDEARYWADQYKTLARRLERERNEARRERDALYDIIDCACNALTDSISVGGNDRETNMHWVRKMKREASKVKP
jgi:hypothetical protein